MSGTTRAVPCVLSAAAALAAAAASAQTPAAAENRSARDTAPVDLTGYWVSVVTEDWMFRMVTPPKGEFLGVPLNAEGRRVANAWDPAADEAAGEACRAYGAPALMRIPGRLAIAWEEGGDVLRIDAEAGMQTRRLHFDAEPPAGLAPTLQGYSVAEWEIDAGPEKHGNLKVETTQLSGGYLRKNGVPYGARARLTEYFDVYDAPNGDTWLVVTSIVTDPEYLTTPFITSSHFKKLDPSDGRKFFEPVACTAR